MPAARHNTGLHTSFVERNWAREWKLIWVAIAIATKIKATSKNALSENARFQLCHSNCRNNQKSNTFTRTFSPYFVYKPNDYIAMLPMFGAKGKGRRKPMQQTLKCLLKCYVGRSTPLVLVVSALCLGGSCCSPVSFSPPLLLPAEVKMSHWVSSWSPSSPVSPRIPQETSCRIVALWRHHFPFALLRIY